VTVHGEAESQPTLDADAREIRDQVAALSTHPHVAVSDTANPSPAQLAELLNAVTTPNRRP
jgi:hypothetical protein